MKQIRILAIVTVLLALLTGASVQAQDPVEIRWYVGLGAGTDAPVIEAQEQVVADFNESQMEIELVLEIVDTNSAQDVLNTQIAAGNAPDIVGPMGIKGRDAFPGAWLDLTPLIESTNYDLSDFDPALIEFYKVDDGQTGIPFAVFPSFIIYNIDLFDEAGIPYPPRNYGDPYVDWDGVEREWNLDTLRELAMILTVDADGNDATMEEFDPDNIIQWGFGNQYASPEGALTPFGAGLFVDDEGNAAIPDSWMEGLEWRHDAMWKDYFTPNANYNGSDLLAGGQWFGSGNVAMVQIHTWFFGWGTADLVADWQLAPVPSYNGETVAKLHADTFGIMKTTEHPEEAFEVLTYLVGDRALDLAKIYNGMPARLSLQDAYFEDIAQTDWASGRGIHFDLLSAALAYPDNPNHESGLPGNLEARDRIGAFDQEFGADPDYDIEAGVQALLADLQTIYEASR